MLSCYKKSSVNKAGRGLSDEIALTNVEQQVQISSNRLMWSINNKWLVSAPSGLTMGVNTLAMGDEARVQAVASSFIEAKAVGLEQPGTGEGVLECTGRVHTLHKREVAINYVCGAKKTKKNQNRDILMFHKQLTGNYSESKQHRSVFQQRCMVETM